jgi:hypothetical protein
MKAARPGAWAGLVARWLDGWMVATAAVVVEGGRGACGMITIGGTRGGQSALGGKDRGSELARCLAPGSRTVAQGHGRAARDIERRKQDGRKAVLGGAAALRLTLFVSE